MSVKLRASILISTGEGFGESEGAMHFRKAGNLIPKKLQNQKQRTRALVGGDR